MNSNNSWSQYGRHLYLLKRFRSIGVVFLSIFVIVSTVFIIFHVRNNVGTERRELLRVWNDGDFDLAYEMSKISLVERPTDYFLLTIHGFSAYQLGISQINNQNMLNFINESIFSLRKALLQKESGKDGRLYYVLGKAYGFKGSDYADLAVYYLEKANDLSFEAVDIPEFLGLAYAAFGDYRNSVEAFSRAFVPGRPPSDNLLLSIARSYIAMGENDIAFSYLQRCIDVSPDSKVIVIARLLLAEVYINSGAFDDAQAQYLTILNESGENAEVRFQLGELFNMTGDTTRARSEWRMAFRQDPAHVRARARLNI